MLAKLAGVPQSHISKIESGAVDLRVSSLVQIARALDLEVTLVPRRNLSVVRSIIRDTERSDLRPASDPSSVKELRKLQRSLRDMLHEHPVVKELAQLQRHVRDLQRLSIRAADLGALREATEAVRAFEDTPRNLRKLRDSLAGLQRMRNALAHDVPPAGTVAPAYDLADDDDD